MCGSHHDGRPEAVGWSPGPGSPSPRPEEGLPEPTAPGLGRGASFLLLPASLLPQGVNGFYSGPGRRPGRTIDSPQSWEETGLPSASEVPMASPAPPPPLAVALVAKGVLQI